MKGRLARRRVLEPPDTDVELHDQDPTEEVPNWMFVSHTGLDEAFIRTELEPLSRENQVVLHLVNGGSSPVVSRLYKRMILRSLSRCRWFLVVASQAAIPSKWVRFELAWALANRSTTQRVAVRRDCAETALHPDFDVQLIADYRADQDEARRRLREILMQVGAA